MPPGRKRTRLTCAGSVALTGLTVDGWVVYPGRCPGLFSIALSGLGGAAVCPQRAREEMNTACPVCDSDGILTGDSEIDPPVDDQSDPFLSFTAYSFECDECGLVLNDTQEIELAGMDVAYDRNDELDDWLFEHYANV